MRTGMARIVAGAALMLIAGCQSASERSAATPAGSPSGNVVEVIERHGFEFLDIPGVVTAGDDVVDGKTVIVIYVEKETPQLVAQLPKELEGYRVVIREDED